MIDREAMMHRMYGKTTDRKCGECRSLIKVQAGGKVVYKCLRYGDTRSTASDWRLKYEACGLFDKPIPRYWKPAIEVVKHLPKNVLQPPLEGQMRIDDFE